MTTPEEDVRPQTVEVNNVLYIARPLGEIAFSQGFHRGVTIEQFTGEELAVEYALGRITNYTGTLDARTVLELDPSLRTRVPGEPMPITPKNDPTFSPILHCVVRRKPPLSVQEAVTALGKLGSISFTELRPYEDR